MLSEPFLRKLEVFLPASSFLMKETRMSNPAVRLYRPAEHDWRVPLQICQASGLDVWLQLSCTCNVTELVGDFCTIGGPEFAHDVANMNLDGAFAQLEFQRDILVALATP